MDPDCNHFRDFLFDHPCGFVLKKAEKDPYPIDALPTCNHALSVCQQERKCLKLFEDFKTHCKVRDNKCKMENRDACHDAWTNLRLSPMFGCICPNNHMKKRCDRIFNIVNHNPCVDRIIFFPNGLPKLKPKPKTKLKSRRKQKQKHAGHHNGQHPFNGTELLSNNIEYQYHDEPNNEHRLNREEEQEQEQEEAEEDDDDDEDTDDDDYDDRIRAEIYSNYPHYLHPPSWGINNPLVLASHSPHTSEDDDDVIVEVPTSLHHGHKTQQQAAANVADDVVVVVDAGPAQNQHTHTHPHTHTYYSHGVEPSTTMGPTTTTRTSNSPKYANAFDSAHAESKSKPATFCYN
ncbi:GH14172 [Drosophila grimshawi]|uniref:GH14172 n=1 Tax=Drosophila grimshawi TaxID=7222 RepID=B4JXU4_DROGR|nr:GH14172 [Drosophila grimshawi]